MRLEKIIWLIHVSRIKRINLIVVAHNFLVRYRLLFLILIIVSFFFAQNLIVSFSLLTSSLLIYVGPKFTDRWINSLKERIEVNNQLNQEYFQLWTEMVMAENKEKYEAVLKKIVTLNNKDADFKLSLKIMVLSKWTRFIFVTIILALAALGTGIFLVSRLF